MSLDRVAWHSEGIATEMLECGYHLGPAVAARLLQRALNAFGEATLGLDGNVGPKTLQHLLAFLNRRRRDGGEAVLLTVLNSLQCAAYVERVEALSSKRAFLFGWVAKRVRIQS
jgi:typhoid toxin secretion A